MVLLPFLARRRIALLLNERGGVACFQPFAAIPAPRWCFWGCC